MDIVQLKKQIKDRQLNNFYILAGEEIGVLNMYIKQMSKNIIRADEVGDIWRALTSRTLNDTSDVVFVVRDDKKFMAMEKVWTGLKNKIVNGTLVICITNIDKRSKFYKEFRDDVVVFEKMTDAQLLQYCRKHLKGVNDNVLKHLIYLCDNDFSRIENEIDKIVRLKAKQINEQLLEDLIIPPKDSTAFTFTDAVLRGEYDNAIYDLNCLLSNNESGVMLLGLLYSNFRNAILVVGNKPGESGVNGYVAKTLQEKLVYSPNELLSILRIIQKYESGIKKGIYEERFAIQAATLEILCV